MEADKKEIEEIRERYLRRKTLSKKSLLNPNGYMPFQEKERALIRWIKKSGVEPVHDKKVLEIGCGFGANLIELIRLGFQPENLVANELLEDRASQARRLLPKAVDVLVGDASTLNLEDGSFDIVLQWTVFTSILDMEFQQKLANRIWSLLKSSGGILWYDFVYDNPKNPDVKGIPVKRIRELFPYGEIKVWRLTLAPPIARFVTKIHPALYTAFNSMSFLRTHVMCWIKKAN